MTAQLNGRPATVEHLASAVGGYGHFTTLRVTDGTARGLADHLARLADAHRRVFDADLDTGFVRECLRRAVPARGTVIARITLVGSPFADTADVLVTLREAGGTPAAVRLRTVRALRAMPEIKHTGTFAQHFHARAARRAGFDDALFVTGDGHIGETSVCTIGFLGPEGTVVWPDAPVLPGVTQQLLTRGLAGLGVRVEQRPVPVADVGTFRAAFVANAGSLLRPVSAVDHVALPLDDEWMSLLRRAYDTNPPEPV